MVLSTGRRLILRETRAVGFGGGFTLISRPDVYTHFGTESESNRIQRLRVEVTSARAPARVCVCVCVCVELLGVGGESLQKPVRVTLCM